MALDLKVLVQLDIQGGSVWITDKTGEYDAVSNVGGWGDASTKDLNKSALVVVAVYNAETPSNLAPVGADVIFDSGALNTKETTFELTYGTDGWHSVALFRLPVTADGASSLTTLDAEALDIGDYFYDDATSTVNIVTATSPIAFTEVTDFSVMIADINTAQEVCERLFMVKLAIKKKEIYWDYKTARDTKGQCKETDNLFRKLLDLRFDMEGAFDAFWSGLKVEAHDVTESLLKQHKIT